MKTVIKGWRWLLGVLLGVLGFSGCFSTACRKEYGCPSADFKLVGDVKDADGKGIEGIRVACLQYFPASGSFSNESALLIRWPKY